MKKAKERKLGAKEGKLRGGAYEELPLSLQPLVPRSKERPSVYCLATAEVATAFVLGKLRNLETGSGREEWLTSLEKVKVPVSQCQKRVRVHILTHFHSFPGIPSLSFGVQFQLMGSS